MKKGKKEQGERKGRKLGRGLLPRRFQPPGFGGSDARPHTPRPMPRNPPSFLNTFVRASRLDRQKPRESDDVRRLASARGLRPSRSCWGSASMLLSLVCRQSLVSGNGTRRRNMIFMFMFTSKRSFLVGIFLRLQGHRDAERGKRFASGRGRRRPRRPKSEKHPRVLAEARDRARRERLVPSSWSYTRSVAASLAAPWPCAGDKGTSVLCDSEGAGRARGGAGGEETPRTHGGKGRHMRSLWLARRSGVMRGRARDSVTVVLEGSDDGDFQARARSGAPPCEVEARRCAASLQDVRTPSTVWRSGSRGRGRAWPSAGRQSASGHRREFGRTAADPS